MEQLVNYTSKEAVCIYCGGFLYYLSDGRVKCASCNNRYSIKKITKEFKLIDAFCSDLTAHRASKECNTSYVTAKSAYNRYRKMIMTKLESDYEELRESVVEYDEYIYLDHTKRKEKKNIFSGYNFITFDYGNRVYNIMLPSLDRYKNYMIDDGLSEIYYEQLSMYLKIHRVSRIDHIDNTIEKFWRYFDNFMKRFRGVNRDYFIYYLKEAEFKFNYKSQSNRVLRNLWLQSMRGN